MKLLILPLLLVLVSCSAETNILGKTTPAEHLATFENLLDLAQAAYDRNDLKMALRYSEQAYKLNEDSEDAALLYGFVNLSLAGGDPFSLAKGLTADAKAKNEADQAADPAAPEQPSGTAGTLASLKSVLAIKDEELLQMSSKDETDPALPILIPGCVEDARATVARLKYLKSAVLAVCRFVDDSAKVSDDYLQQCEPYDGPHEQRHKAHFLWAFAHLTEALAFNSILTYATTDQAGSQTNLELRAQKIQAIDASKDLQPLLAAITSLDKTLKAVMPAGGACSEAAPTTQLRATLNDMLAVDAAFSLIPGMPKKITARVANAMNRIKGATDASGDSRGAQAQALKGDFSKRMAKGVADKIDRLDTPLSASQKTAVCSAYSAVAAGSGETSTLCGGEN